MTWLVALLATLAIEVPLAMVLVRQPSRARVALWAAFASATSHPVLSFVVLPHFPGPFVLRVLVGETLVIAYEAAVYRKFLGLAWPHALALSAVLNAASFLIGLAVFG